MKGSAFTMMMQGYDLEKAVAFMTPRFDVKEFKPLAPQLDSLLRQAIAADMDFMRKSGVLGADGLMGEAFYDDDEAFEFILDRLARDNHLKDGAQGPLASFIDQYMDLQEAFLSDNGMMDWD